MAFRITVFSALVLLLCSFTKAQASAPVITIRSDYWCPYVCDPQTQRPGYLVEVARLIYSKYGYKIDLKIMNRARSVNDLQKGKAHALFAGHNDHLGFVIPVKSAGQVSNHFFAKNISTWSYKDAASLRGKRIGVINGYSYGKEIDQLIENQGHVFVKISGERPLHQIIKMMEAGRLDAFIENPLVLRHTLSQLHKPTALFKTVSSNLATSPLVYLAFSTADLEANHYADLFTKGLLQLRRSGELRSILEKYNIKDWEETPLMSIAKGAHP